MNKNHEQRVRRWAVRGEVSIKNIIFAVIAIAMVVFVLRAVFGTVKEASTAVSERNKKVIESRKALVTEQTERIKNAREAQAVP